MLSFQPSAQDVDGARAALVLIMAGVAIFWHLVPPVLLAIVVLAGRGRSPIRHQAGNLQYRYDVQ